MKINFKKYLKESQIDDIMILDRYSNYLLNIIDNADTMSRSELQAVTNAAVANIYYHRLVDESKKSIEKSVAPQEECGIRVYSIDYTEDDVEFGDIYTHNETDERFIGYNEGYDNSDIVEWAIETLKDLGTISPSSSSFSPGVWYSTIDDEMNFRTGIRTNEEAFLVGFEPEEEELVFNILK